MGPGLRCKICHQPIDVNRPYLRDEDSPRDTYHNDCFREKHPDIPITGLEPSKSKKRKTRGKRLGNMTFPELRKEYKKRFRRAAPTDSTKQEVLDSIKAGKPVQDLREKTTNKKHIERELDLIPQVLPAQDNFFNRFTTGDPKMISTKFNNLDAKKMGDVMVVGGNVLRWAGEGWIPEATFLRNNSGFEASPIRTDQELQSMTSPFVFQRNPGLGEQERGGFDDPDSALKWAKDNMVLVDDTWWDERDRSFHVKFRPGPSNFPRPRMVVTNPSPAIHKGFLLARDDPVEEGLEKCGACREYEPIGESTGKCRIARGRSASSKIAEHLPCGFGVMKD